jgi:two-component system alkaline phosphatase synthesis response regulator PhoP
MMIFCVEDDDSSRELMVYALAAAGYEVQGFADGTAFREALKHITPDLILLDIMLPDENGISILKKLRNRAQTADVPVIMASAKGTEYDKVVGLDLGADDYLAKPFGMTEMVSRVKAVLRRSSRHKAPTLLRAGQVELNESAHTVLVHGKPVELTLKEYELLRLFMGNPGKVFSREALLASVWDMDFGGETRTVDVHVGTLRMKLQDQGELIRTVRGVGYKMEDR